MRAGVDVGFAAFSRILGPFLSWPFSWRPSLARRQSTLFHLPRAMQCSRTICETKKLKVVVIAATIITMEESGRE